MTEHRRFTRILFEHPAELQFQQHCSPAKLFDLSMHGALVACSLPKSQINDEVELHIHLYESEKPITINAAIRHKQSERLGLEFKLMDLDSASRLRRVLELNLGDEKLLYRQFEQLIESVDFSS